MVQKNNQNKLNKFIRNKYSNANAAVTNLTNIICNVTESTPPLVDANNQAQTETIKADTDNYKLLRAYKIEFNKANRNIKTDRHNNDRIKELIVTRSKYRKIKYNI